MTTFEVLGLLFQFVGTMFCLGFAYETLNNDDDDDQDGGILQPCYVTQR
ncbi:hypothetical protein [Synechococcus phage S-N03]|uniref:Uncharacterized protein n=1 Tax=Synechococcus phage S-N03 TaxID=2718943 RepID=A0A6G8R5L4_9CAUD|nr:hypothetical protein PQC09_gp041 [Synechococcus phage S-N03]QIN96676.1 hypothetical protein [Synechococcus phage S-N03]